MAFSFSIKNIPDELAERLRARARMNHRSLQRELLLILEQATTAVPALAGPLPQPGERIPIDEIHARARALFTNGTRSSVDVIREARDA